MRHGDRQSMTHCRLGGIRCLQLCVSQAKQVWGNMAVCRLGGIRCLQLVNVITGQHGSQCDHSEATTRQYPGSSVSVSCNVMTTILSLQEKSRCEATGQSMAQPQAGVCLAGKAGVRPTIDGLVTHTSKAGVCVRQHGSRRQQGSRPNTDEATWQSEAQPQAVSCNVMTGAAGARSCVSRRQSRCEAHYRRPGHKHKQSRCEV